MLADTGHVTILLGIFGVLTLIYLQHGRKKPIFPIANSYPNDFFRKKAYLEWEHNARQLIAAGLATSGGKPITVQVRNEGLKIVLPSSLTDWVKKCRDLDHQELVRCDYFANIPGGEPQATLHSPNNIVIDVIKSKLAQNESILPTVQSHVVAAIRQYWEPRDSNTSWYELNNWDDATTGVISRAAAAIFVGPERAVDPEWQHITRSYVSSYFSAVPKLHSYPKWSRKLVHWALPEWSACRKFSARARVIMREMVSKREQEKKDALREGKVLPEYNDTVEWTTNLQLKKLSSGGLEKQEEPGDIQLALAMASLFTTAELLRQIIVDLAQHPELVGALRKEIRECVIDQGLSIASLRNMELLDSVMKESQRSNPTLVGLERKVIRDTTLPDGTKLPKGTTIMVDASGLWSTEVHGNPQDYDGYRFLKKLKAGDPNGQFVQSSKEHNVFGGGRHLCPGRFFAANELKLCIAHILLSYDIRLKDGYVPAKICIGAFGLADPNPQLLVRRISQH